MNIKNCFDKYEEYEFFSLTSTGKDSTVVVDLVNKVRDTQVVFNNTSLDCAPTYKMAKGHSDWIITNPSEGFYQFIIRKNFIPTRFSRACCGVFKEGNHINYFKDKVEKAVWFMGVRNDESISRADREDYTHNPKWGDLDWHGCLPIRQWSDFDVWLYILKNNLEVNLKYKQGYSRVGCAIACPFATKYTWVLDEYFYPLMRNRWVKILDEDFVQGERWSKLNCTKEEYRICWNGGLYRDEPTDEVIREFMEYKDLRDINVSRKYFNKTCVECGKNVRQPEVIGMNLKFFSKAIDGVYCKKCLQKKMSINNEAWDRYVEDFKSQGCNLF